MSKAFSGRALPVVLLFVAAGIAACMDRRAEESLQAADGHRITAASGQAAGRIKVTAPSAQAGGTAASTALLEGTAGGVRFSAGSGPTTPPALPAMRQQVTQPSMIIRNGDVAIEVDSVEAAIATVRQLVTSLGGYVGNVSMFTGEHQVRTATLELKVPAARFDDAMAGVRPLGKVERSVATAEDVGEEFVDISARVANARRLESRLVTLLATRTGRLEDVLRVERELARVREEIERYEGRIRFLASRVAISTIAVTVHEKAPLVATSPGRNILKQAFINMWRNFVRFIATGIELMGVAIPVFVLGLAGWFVWKRWRVRRVTPTAAEA